MNPLQLIMIAINGLSVVTNNPALGGGSSLRLQEASEMLSFLGAIISRGEEGYRELKEFADLVEAMAKEGRAPTPAELSTLKARSDAAHTTIQDAAAAAEVRLEERRKLEEELGQLEGIPAEDLTPEQANRIDELEVLLED